MDHMEACLPETGILVRNIKLPVGVSPEEACAEAARRLAGLVSRRDILSYTLYRKSVDARRRDALCFVYSILAETTAAFLDAASGSDLETRLAKRDAVLYRETGVVLPPCSRMDEKTRPLIVGLGPCGMFCALLLAENGYRPIVIERGEDPVRRKAAVEAFYYTGELNTESNIQFGAGGAGTFSDGKLVTRVNDPRCRYVMRRMAGFGAPPEVMTEAKPHVGTDKLLGMVENICHAIVSLGGDILFNTRFEAIGRTEGGHVRSVLTSAGEMACGSLVLAIGHSARDTVFSLQSAGFDVVSKPFSVGVRIEHLQTDIDHALYGGFAGHPALGHAEYALSLRQGENAVYSFCMCPGGEVVAAASEEGGVVTNGMSRYHRDGVNANAALAVSVMPDDPIGFQRSLERAAFAAGGGSYIAPVQTVGDFLEGRMGTPPSRIRPTYMGGDRYRLCDLTRILPPDVVSMLRLGISRFDKNIGGFAAPDAVLTGVETRTSSPVRILRTPLMTTARYDNVYPCGEGAGYAGGITSAALDGISCAERVACRLSGID